MATQIAIPPETLAAFGGDELRARILLEKYTLRDLEDRIVETRPEQMWDRVARELAGVEPDAERRERSRREFRWLLDGFRFLPGGRILHGAGNARKVTLINCFFEKIQEDSIEGIYTAAMHAARTYSRGGGIGICVSPLRPAQSAVHNAARYSTGAVSFMELFSLTTGLIGQSGRRGALLLSIEDRHPDVLEFCQVKRNLTQVRFANISVKLSDAFMRAVEQDGPWTLWFESQETGRIERTIRARALWDELTTGARDWAEPGCLFWDTTKRMGTSEYNGMHVEGCNPCAEQILGHGDCCDLGSINLARFVLDPFTPSAAIDWKALERAARAAVRFLDNVHEYSLARHLYPLPHQEAAARRGRRVGVGILGLGDMLVQLGLRYDSDEAIRTAGQVMEFLKLRAYEASAELAAEKGPFEAWDADQHLAQAFYRTFPEPLLEKIRTSGLRNVSVLTIPPVGSGAALAGVTNGLEPIFALSYVRRSESLRQEFFAVLHPLVRAYLRQAGRQIDEADSEMAGRLISLALRLQAPSSRLERLGRIREQLEGIGGGDPYGFGPNRVRSIADAIAKAIGWHLAAKREATSSDSGGSAELALTPASAAVPPAETLAEPDAPAPVPIAGGSNGNLCPQCHQYSLITDQGCTKCRECSYKEC